MTHVVEIAVRLDPDGLLRGLPVTPAEDTEIDVANACIESLNSRYGMGLAL